MTKLLNFILAGVPGFARSVWQEAEANNMRITGLAVIGQSIILLITVIVGIYGAYMYTPAVMANTEISKTVSNRLDRIEAGQLSAEIINLVTWRCKARDSAEYNEMSLRIEEAQQDYRRLTGDRYPEQRCY